MSYPSMNPTIGVAVEAVVLFCDDWYEEPDVLLIRRSQEPFTGRLALPGGLMGYGEAAKDAVGRGLYERTALRSDRGDWLDLPTQTEPTRDPRRRVISLPFLKVVGTDEVAQIQSGDDADEVVVMPLSAALEADLAFDHKDMLMDAREAFHEMED